MTNTPIDDDYSISSSTGYWVTLLARSMEYDLEERLKVHGITRATFALLSAIYHDKKTTPAALASFIGIDGAAITRHLDRIEKQGLILRERSVADRRSVNLKLTRKRIRSCSQTCCRIQSNQSKVPCWNHLRRDQGYSRRYPQDAVKRRCRAA